MVDLQALSVSLSSRGKEKYGYSQGSRAEANGECAYDLHVEWQLNK